ncbi:MAG: hypothetical protein Q4A42_02860 [Tissierellia bacterium]|nr:hypothetical protein [Tissierellia bacterium]
MNTTEEKFKNLLKEQAYIEDLIKKMNLNVDNIRILLDTGIKVNEKLKREKLKLENIENELIGVSSIDYSKEKVQSSIKDSSIKEFLLDNKDITTKKINDMESYLEEYTRILKKEIEKIKDDEIKSIMELKLIKFYSWRLIYNFIPYSKSSILRKFKQGKRLIIKNYKGA